MLNRRTLCVGLSGVATAAAAGRAWAAQPHLQRAVSRRTVRIGGRLVRYRAIVAETLLAANESRPPAIGVTNAYVRETRGNLTRRPVLFAFNGGPGASSSPLHFAAFGPRLLQRPSGEPARFADNAHSPLDAMDIVFIDPVGTGYARMIDDADGAPYWEVMGDARAAVDIVQDWLRVNGREGSPKFLLGESYGATRAAAMLEVGGVRFDGVLCFVGSLGFGESDDLRAMHTLPSMATTAAFHGRAEAGSRSPAQIFEDAYQFAIGDYALALIKGSEVPGDEAQSVAARLSRLIGLPAETILARDLRIDVEFYVRELLKDRNLRIGRLDTRVTGPLDAPAARPPFDDPSMSRSRSVGGATYDDYFRDLGFHAPAPYNALNLNVNSAWNFGSRRDGAANYARFIGDAMARDPALRFYSGVGYYDLGVPVAGMRYALAHGGAPMARVDLRYYPTGHSLFDGDENLARLAGEVRAFTRGGS